MKKNVVLKILTLILIILAIIGISNTVSAEVITINLNQGVNNFANDKGIFCLTRSKTFVDGDYNAEKYHIKGKDTDNFLPKIKSINSNITSNEDIYKIVYILSEANNDAMIKSMNTISTYPYQQAIWKITSPNYEYDSKIITDSKGRTPVEIYNAACAYAKYVSQGSNGTDRIKKIDTTKAELQSDGTYGPFYIEHDSVQKFGGQNYGNIVIKVTDDKNNNLDIKNKSTQGTKTKFYVNPKSSSIKISISVSVQGYREAEFYFCKSNKAEVQLNIYKDSLFGLRKAYSPSNNSYFQCYDCYEIYNNSNSASIYLCTNKNIPLWVTNNSGSSISNNTVCPACNQSNNGHMTKINNNYVFKMHVHKDYEMHVHKDYEYRGILRYNDNLYYAISYESRTMQVTNFRELIFDGRSKGYQPLIKYITTKINEENKTETYDLIPPLNLNLNKVNDLDLTGEELYNIPNIKFNIKVEQDGKVIHTETVTTDKNGKLSMQQVKPKSRNDITITITEEHDDKIQDGYKALSEPIVLKLKCIEGKYWKAEESGNLSGEERYIVNSNTNSKTGITIKLENKSIIEKLTILKTSSVGVEAVAGAKFKLTLTNVTSIKNYQIPTTGATQATSKTIFVTTDAKGNIVLEDIEIADLSKNVTIEIEEIEAPVGYKKIEGKITVTLKRKGNTYTIHKAEKEDTVTDDEFKAGEVTLTNHELILNIKDIPVMNLGGIVWAEDEKTGKAPTSSDIYGDGNSEEALGGIKVSLTTLNGETVKDIYGNEVKDVYTSDGNAKATYVNNKGENKTVDLDLGKYMFTNIPAGTNYKVIFEYDGITYNAITTSKENAYINNNCSKIEQEPSRTNFNNMTKTVEGSGDVNKSVVNGGWNINYDINGNKAFYTGIIDPETNSNQYMYGHSFAYLNKKSDWIDTWNKDDGTINTEHYAFDINCGLNKKYFDLNLGTDVESATVKINGNQTTYSYDQILDGKLDEALNKSSDSEIEYNLYLANSDYYYRIADYKVPGEGAIENKYDEEALNKEQIESAKKDSELEVYVTYRIELKNQSTQHDAKVNLVEYHFDDKYAFLQEKNKNIKLTEETNLNNRVLIIDTSDLQINGGETKSLDLTFKVLPDKNGNKCVLGEDYLNQAEIVSYTTGGGLVDADSAPGNAFLDTKENKVRYEDDTDEANGIKIQLKENAERSISGKVFNTKNNNGVNDVIVQLIELVEINNKQYEYIWQETVAGSNTVKTTDRNGYTGKSYSFESDDKNNAGEYKFTQGIIPGNYIVRFIYGDRTYFDESIESKNATEESKNNIKTYNGEDYKSTYVDYDYNAPWYNNTSLNGDNSKAVDNEARRLKVMSYAVDVNGERGAELALLSKSIGTDDEKLKAVLENTWMCAETLKIKVPVDTDDQKDVRDELTVSNGNAPRTEYTQFNNVNFGLMERPKTKLVLEKHITGLTVKPVASGVNLIANATANISDILEGDTITLEGQKDGLIAIKSGREERGQWYLQTDTTELAQGADAYITYTYVIKNEGDGDYLSETLVNEYKNDKEGTYQQYLENQESLVKEKIKSKGFTKGEYLSGFYYTGKTDTKNNFNPTSVLATVEELQETLNPKVSFVNSTTDFTVDKNDTKKKYYDTEGSLQDVSIKESVTSTTGTGKMELNSNDTSKKLVVSVGLSASEIENSGVYDSYIAQITHYTNAAGRRDQSTPENLAYVHSEDKNMNMESYKDSSGNMITGQKIEDDGTQYFLYKVNDSEKVNVTNDIKFEKDKLIYKEVIFEKLNENDEFWAERFIITKPTGEDKLTTVQIAIISISAVVILGVGIILIKKFVLKK